MEMERFKLNIIRFAEVLGAEGSTATFTAGNLKEKRGSGGKAILYLCLTQGSRLATITANPPHYPSRKFHHVNNA